MVVVLRSLGRLLGKKPFAARRERSIFFLAGRQAKEQPRHDHMPNNFFVRFCKKKRVTTSESRNLEVDSCSVPPQSIRNAL